MRRMIVCCVVVAVMVGGVLSRAGEGEGTRRGFAGMIGGKVLGRTGTSLSVEITRIERTWKHSRMENPQSLVGTTVRIVPREKNSNVARYARTLRTGDADSFDVKQDGDAMVWLELTKVQRERIGVDKKKR